MSAIKLAIKLQAMLSQTKYADFDWAQPCESCFNQWLITLKMFLDTDMNKDTLFVGISAFRAGILISKAQICTQLQTRLLDFWIEQIVNLFGKMNLFGTQKGINNEPFSYFSTKP